MMQTVSTDKMVLKVTDALVKGLREIKSELKPEFKILSLPKSKEWKLKITGENGKLKHIIKAKQI